MNMPVKAQQGFSLVPTTMTEAMQLAEMVARSTICPPAYKGKPGDIVIAMMYGQELGLKPMQSLQNIAVINNRPSIWGDAMIALVQHHPDCEYIDENESTEKVGVCKVKRRGKPEQVRRFTLQEAHAAGLTGKQGPWKQYTTRMLKLRARAYALRDVFADVLSGLSMAEEAQDMEAIEVIAQDVQTAPGGAKPATRTEDIKQRLKARQQAAEAVTDAEIIDSETGEIISEASAVTLADVLASIDAADTKKTLAEAAALALQLTDDADKAAAREAYGFRQDELKKAAAAAKQAKEDAAAVPAAEVEVTQAEELPATGFDPADAPF